MHVEVRLHELRVGQVELDRLPGLRIHADRGGGLGVGLLEGADAVARMDVHRGAQAALVQAVQEALGVGEQLGVPRVASPAGAVLGVDVVHQMPVHVDHRRGERNAFALEPVHQVQVLLLGVPVVAAPPVAQRVAGQQRRGAGKLLEVVDGLAVAAAVPEEVDVGFAMVARGNADAAVRHDAVGQIAVRVGGDEHVRRGVVQHGPAIAGDHALSERNRAVGLVERARGAAEIAFGLVAVMPGVELRVRHALDDDRQPLLAERLAVVGQTQRRRFDDEHPVAFAGGVVHGTGRQEGAVDGHQRGSVLELAAVGPFQTDQGFGDQSDAPVLTLQRGGRIHCGMHAPQEVVKTLKVLRRHVLPTPLFHCVSMDDYACTQV